jgi:hypothetical protein
LKQSSQKILQSLDEIVRQESVKAVIDSLVPRVEQKLKKDSEALLAWEPVPLDTYGKGLPDIIRSSWVFIVRAQAESGAERHPNSHQYMMSYKGSGDLQAMNGEKWESNFLVSGQEKGIESRWVSVPPYTWHQAVASKENWIVVSFHTASEEELIEERPDPTDAQLTRQRLYSNK